MLIFNSPYYSAQIDNIINPFNDAHCRLKRAIHVKEELENAIRLFVMPMEQVLVLKPTENDTISISIVYNFAIPLELSPVIGEVVYNLRSFLDYIVFVFSVKPVGIIGAEEENKLKRVYFPILGNEEDLVDKVEEYSWDQSFKEILIESQPLRGGAHKLWELNLFANRDKHRALTLHQCLAEADGFSIIYGNIHRVFGKESMSLGLNSPEFHIDLVSDMNNINWRRNIKINIFNPRWRLCFGNTGDLYGLDVGDALSI